jgi:hypothetical protein
MTWAIILIIVLAVLLFLAVAAVVRFPQRLTHRKPLETDPESLADPLPLSTVTRKR